MAKSIIEMVKPLVMKETLTYLKERVKNVRKIIKGIEKDSEYDSNLYPTPTDYEKELSYYEGKLDELQSIINQIKTK